MASTTINFTATNSSGSVGIDVAAAWAALTSDQQTTVSQLCYTLFGVGFGTATAEQKAFTLVRYGVSGHWTMNPGSSRFED